MKGSRGSAPDWEAERLKMYEGPEAVSSEGDVSMCRAGEEVLAWEVPAESSSEHI